MFLQRRTEKTIAFLTCWLTLAAVSQLSAQTSPAQLAAAQAIAAQTGGGGISDAVLTATVTRKIGPDSETGIATLKVRGNNQSKLELGLPSGTHTEIKTLNASPTPVCSWHGSDGIAHPAQMFNCTFDSGWFFPPLSILSVAANLYSTDLGTGTWNGTPAEHLQFWQDSPNAKPVGVWRHLTTIDFYLDPNTHLPIGETFLAHPDRDGATDFRVRIVYSDYRAVGQATVPFRIQKYVNGMLELDVSITNVSLNTGLTDSDFVN